MKIKIFSMGRLTNDWLNQLLVSHDFRNVTPIVPYRYES
jgi:hypothetical protein